MICQHWQLIMVLVMSTNFVVVSGDIDCFMDPFVFVGIQTMMIRGGELDGCEFKKMRLVKQEPYTVEGCFQVYNVVYDRVSTNIQVGGGKTYI